MKFTCDNCSAQYMISDEKVGPSGVKVRCKKCGTVIPVRRPAVDAAQAAPAAAHVNGAAHPGGLDAELGQAFDHAFGDPPEKGADLGATQAMSSDDAAKIAAAPVPAATEWYVAIGQAQVGPLPLAEVKKKWEAGDVSPESLVWRPGMADWSPLSTVGDLSAYLSPVKQAARGARAEARSDAAPARSRAAEPGGGAGAVVAAPAAEVSWKPAGANALAALASEEIASRAAPAARPEAPKAAPGGVRSLVDAMDLPDGGGVDPTGAIPLPIKGLEQTGDRKLERRSSVAKGAEEVRQRRNASRTVSLVVAIVVLVVGGAAAGVVYYLNRKVATVDAIATAPAPRPAPQPEPAAAPQPAPQAPAAASAAPATAPAPQGAIATTAPAPAKPAPVAEPKPAEPPPAVAAAKPPPAKAAVEPPARPARTRHEPPPRQPPPAETRVAQATPPPAPAPQAAPQRKKDSVLDFESNDAALDDALGSGGGGSTRSVYVPPRPGGDVPAKLSPAQINEAVAQRIDPLRRCVQEQKAREPDASGVLKMRWIIAGDGSVREVKTLTPEFENGRFAQCITGVIKTIKFPQSKTTGQEVTFPFQF